MRIVRAIFLSFAIYGFAAWIYVALCAIVHPETLSLTLTHVTPWIREDTFGILSFIISFISFFLWKASEPTKSR